jgi:hypothetical protein
MWIRLKDSREAVEAAVSAGSVEDLGKSVANADTLELGLPQNLGKRFAFPTAPTSLELLGLSIRKMEGLS